LVFFVAHSLENLSFTALSEKKFLFRDLFLNDVSKAERTRQGRNTCKLLFGVLTFFFISQQQLHWLKNSAVEALFTN